MKLKSGKCFAMFLIFIAACTEPNGHSRAAEKTKPKQPVIPSASCTRNCMAHIVEEVRRHFTVRGRPIHPYVFRDFFGDQFFGQRATVTAVDLLGTYESEGVKKGRRGYLAYEERAFYQYFFIGRLSNGLVVVLAGMNGGGSGTFYTLFFLDVFVDTAFDEDGKLYERVNLTVVRSIGLGDRWDGEISISGNKVTTTGKEMAHIDGPKTTQIYEAKRPTRLSRSK